MHPYSWFIRIRLVGDFKTHSPYSGFQLKYGLKETEQCGVDHYLSRDTDFVLIKNPKIPNSHVECLWKIKSYYGSRFRIDFEDLQILG